MCSISLAAIIITMIIKDCKFEFSGLVFVLCGLMDLAIVEAIFG